MCPAALLLGIMMTHAIASASTIDTFSFTQSGYTGGGVLIGSFTGKVEADGYIEAADLSAFSATFNAPSDGGTITAYFYLTDLSLFSFLPAADGPNSSLDFYAQSSGLAQNACVGAAAAFGLCGSDGNAVGVANTIGVSESTADFAVVSLVSSTTTPPPSAAPEPATYSLYGLALALVVAGVWRRRRHAPNILATCAS